MEKEGKNVADAMTHQELHLQTSEGIDKLFKGSISVLAAEFGKHFEAIRGVMHVMNNELSLLRELETEVRDGTMNDSKWEDLKGRIDGLRLQMMGVGSDGS